ncbi:hypothetical protein FG386_002422 [Cryptosporidium ryanae]|uniref:uncharacterized protein n=1 Tax=Cryptosporidium ryanae TaxID=515981 RepID=UPI00351A0680|nr:hypothetical protein FG386_002422 [Cryptosporidium ryanae]
MGEKAPITESKEIIIIEADGEVQPNHFTLEKSIIDSLPTLNDKSGFGPITIVATNINNKFKKRTYTGSFEIPVYGENTHIIFYEIELKKYILIYIEKHFVGDIIGVNGKVYINFNKDVFCLNKLELKKNNSETISTECPWGVNIFLEEEISSFKFVPEIIKSFRPQLPPNDWHPITSTTFPTNRDYIEIIKLIKSNRTFTDDSCFSNIIHDGTPSALLFIVDNRYMAIFLSENHSYSYDKQSFTLHKSDGSYYNIFKGLLRTENDLKIITNAPWGNKLLFHEDLNMINDTINEKLNSFNYPSITIGSYEEPQNGFFKKFHRKIRNLFTRFIGNLAVT